MVEISSEMLYQHCLRPILTENVILDLKRGKSLNIYGSIGQGRGRLLADVKNFSWDANTKVIFVDMKNCYNSYNAFLQSFWQAFEGQGRVPDDFGYLMTKLEKSGNYFVILLHHFERLLDNPNIDRRFNVEFMNNLNAVRNNSKMSLVCMTEKPHSHSVIFLTQETNRGSWLNLTTKSLPTLTFDEIGYEIKRRADELSGEKLTYITRIVYQHPLSYRLLQYFCDNLSNQVDVDDEFTDRIKRWRKQYDKDYPLITKSNVHRLTVNLHSWVRILGLRQLFDKMVSLVKIIYGDVFVAFFDWLRGRNKTKRRK